MRTISKLFAVLLLFAVPALAQSSTPAPTTQSNFSVSIGAGALGLGMASNATPASAIETDVQFTKSFQLMSYNLLSGDGTFQYFGGGGVYPVSFLQKALAKTSFKDFIPYLEGTFGADRILISGKPSASHIGFTVGGGLKYTNSSGLVVKMIDVQYGHFPGAPFGVNAPIVSGQVMYAFGKK